VPVLVDHTTANTATDDDQPATVGESTRIAEIGRIVSSTPNLDETFVAFAEQAAELVPFDRLAISMVDSETGLIADAHIIGVETKIRNMVGPNTLENSAIPAAVYEKQEIVAASASKLEEMANSDAVVDNRARIDAGLRSAMFTPIVLQGRLVGSLVFRSKQQDPYGQHQIELASQIAAQIAGVISSNQQFALLERQTLDRERMAVEQSQIAEIGRIVSSTLDFREILSEFGAHAKTLVPHDRLVISSWSEDGLELLDQYVDGVNIEGSGAGRVMNVSKNDVWQRLFVEQQPWVVTGDEFVALKDRDEIERARYDQGLRALLVVPLLWQGRTPGSIAFRSTNPDSFDDREVDLAVKIAAQISGAVAANNQYRLLERGSADRQRLADEQARIAEIGRIVSSALDLDEVFSSFLEQARELIPFDRLVISLVDAEQTMITDVLIDGLTTEVRSADKGYPLVGNFKEDLILNNKTLVANRAEFEKVAERHEYERARLKVGLQSLLAVPLSWQGSVVGALAIRSREPSPYGEHEVEIAEQIGAQIAGAVATSNQFALLEEESAKRAQLADEQARIAEIGRIISSTLDLDEVFSSFLEQARELIPFERLVISLIDAERRTITDVLIDGQIIIEQSSNNQRPVAGDFKEDLINNNETLVANGSEFEEVASRHESERVRQQAGLRSLLAVPLSWQGSVVGALTIRSREPNPYGEREIEITQQIGAQIAGAVAASNQYALLQEESAKRAQLADEQARIAEIGRIISSTLDLDEVFSSFLEQAKEMIPFDRLVISMIDEKRTTITDVLVDGLGMEGRASDDRYQLSGDFIEGLINNNQTLVANKEKLEEVASNHPSEQARRLAGLKSLLAVPLSWQGSVVGMLAFRSREANPYGDHEQNIAKQIGAQIAGAVAASNQYALLQEESAKRAQLADEQARIAEIGRIVSSSLDIEEVLTAFVEQARSLVPFDRIAITVVNDESTEVTDVLVDGLGVGADTIGVAHPFNENILQSGVIANQKTLVANGDEYQRIVESSPTENQRSTAGLRSLLMVPMIWQGRGVGTLNFRSVEPDAYGVQEVELAERIGAQIAGAIATTNQYRKLERVVAEVQTQAAALQAAGDSVMIMKPDTSIEWVNESFVDQSGYSREEAVLRRSPFMRSDKDSSEKHDDMWEQVRAGKTWRTRMWRRRKDGSEFEVDTTVTPVFDDDGNIARYVAVWRDITDLVQAEQDREARRDLDAHNQQLLALSEQREEFFSTVSHELRTPLTSVMAFADILSRDRDGTLTNSQLEQLDVIKRNSRNLNDLVEDMLDFSRLSTDQLRLEKSEFEIHSLLDAVVESFEPTANQRDQKLSIEPHTEPVWIKADYGRMTQVISNLITNSSKYSPESSQISLKVRAKGDHASISVIDHGFGIPAEHLENIYSPFFRSDQTEIRDESGTGLGLAITKTLVDLHGGTIETVSELNVGTEITVTLPDASSTPTVDARP
jgi:PAS domain S-box-containing protein